MEVEVEVEVEVVVEVVAVEVEKVGRWRASALTCGLPKWISSYGMLRSASVLSVALPHAAITWPTLPCLLSIIRDVVMMM